MQEQTIGFDIRLDATDRLDEGDTITEQFGIAPQLSTLELMVHPKDESLLGAGVSDALGKPKGFSFTRQRNPPLILFIFGRKRVLPVNINRMNITETEFSTDLNPVRATVAVSLTVIEGKKRAVPVLEGHDRGDVGPEPGQHHRRRRRRAPGVSSGGTPIFALPPGPAA